MRLLRCRSLSVFLGQDSSAFLREKDCVVFFSEGIRLEGEMP